MPDVVPAAGLMTVNADLIPVILNKNNNYTNDTATLFIQPMGKFDCKFVPYKNV